MKIENLDAAIRDEQDAIDTYTGMLMGLHNKYPSLYIKSIKMDEERHKLTLEIIKEILLKRLKEGVA